MTTRGRPAGAMTLRRQQVLNEYQAMIAEGGKVRLAELARRCGMKDWRNASRIVRDLKRFGSSI